MPVIGPYSDANQDTGKAQESSEEKVPVGSLRFLRSQAAMDSDMNSRRVLAGRELLGDSGRLSEVSDNSMS